MPLDRDAEPSKKVQYKLDKVGTDTEIFLRDIQTGNPVPVIGLIGGTKEKPKPVPELGKGFCVQEDNVMLEYNVPPAKTRDQFVQNVMTMNHYLQGLLLSKGLRPDICESMVFAKEQLNHPQAQHVGCEPDFDVWQRLINPTPKGHPLMATTRTAGGHVHVSFKVNGKIPAFEDVFIKEPIVKFLDITIGLPLLLKYPSSVRRQLYGQPGAFRNKPYGIEYRVPDNQWTRSPNDIEWVWEGIERAFFLANFYQSRLAALASPLVDLTKHVRKADHSKTAEYAHYLLAEFNLLFRVPGLPPFRSVTTGVSWNEFKAA